MQLKERIFGGDWRFLLRCAFVECLGDVIFCFIGTLQGIAAKLTGSILVTAFAHGITMAINIMAMGHITGGHFNPSATLGVLVSGNIAPVQAVIYIIAQLFGGLLGSLLARACVTQETFELIGGGATVPAEYFPGTTEEVTIGQGIVCEIVLTYILVNAILGTAIDTESVLAPFAIGLTIFVDILAGGAISGASMNVARSFGPAVVSCIWGLEGVWDKHYIYWIGPTIGSVLAGLVYKTFLAKEGKRWLLSQPIPKEQQAESH